MKHVTIHFRSPVCLILICMLPASAQEKENPADEAAQAAELEAWVKYATPGESHKHLQKLVGEWKTVTKTYEPGTDKPQVSQGSAKFESLLGDRYVRQTFKGSMGGMPYEGIGIMGYDNARQKHVGTWIDSFGTGILHTEGTYDPKTHTVTDLAEGTGPDGPMKMKMITHYASDDQFTFTMYLLLPDDEEFKMMDIGYTRKK